MDRVYLESTDELNFFFHSYDRIQTVIMDFLFRMDDAVEKLLKDPREQHAISSAEISAFKRATAVKLIGEEIDISRCHKMYNELKKFRSEMTSMINHYAKLRNRIAFGGNYFKWAIKKPKVYTNAIDPEGYELINTNIRNVNYAMDWLEKVILDVFNWVDHDMNALKWIDKVYGKKQIYESVTAGPMLEMVDDQPVNTELITEMADWIDQFAHSESFRESVDATDPMSLESPAEFVEWLRRNIRYGWIPADPLTVAKQMVQHMMTSFTYGLYDKTLGRRRQNSTAEDWVKYQILQSPAELEKTKVGVCWDFATYEAQFMRDRCPDLKVKTYYAQFFHQDPEQSVEDPTHTFLVFRAGGVWFYPEVAFQQLAGIHTADTEEDLINFVLCNMAEHASANLFDEGYEYDVWEYDALDPKLIGMHCNQYMQYVMDNGRCLNHEYQDPNDVQTLDDLEIPVNGTGQEDDEKEFFQYFRLQSPNDLLRTRVGVCWDSVRLEEAWLTAKGYTPTAYYMEINDGENCPSHTFTVYPDEGKFCLIDRSNGWSIKEFNTMNELYYVVQDNFRADHQDRTHPLFIKRLPSMQTGMSCEEYMNRAHEGETVYGEENLMTETGMMGMTLLTLPIYMIKAQACSDENGSGIMYGLYVQASCVSRIMVTPNGYGLYALTREDYRKQGYMEYLISWCVKHTKLRRINVPATNDPMINLLEKIGFMPNDELQIENPDGVQFIQYIAEPEDVDPPKENTWKISDGWLEKNGYDPVLGTINRNGNRFCCSTQVVIEEAAKMADKNDPLVPIYGLCMSYSESPTYNDGTPKNAHDLSDINVRHSVEGITFGDKYSHAAISFDNDLKEIWSYRQIGLAFESIDDSSYMGTDSIYLCVMFVKQSERDRMKQFVQYLVDHKEECKYAFTNIVTQYIGNPAKSDKRFICSTFSGLILSAGNPKNLHRDYSRLRPEDVTILPRAFYLMNLKDAAEFKRRHKEIMRRVKEIKRDHEWEINDYNNMLPKILLKREMSEKPDTVTSLLDRIVKKFMGG